MKMKQVYISYNGCCCVPGPVNKLAIFGFRKNRTNCVTDHTKGAKIIWKMCAMCVCVLSSGAALLCVGWAIVKLHTLAYIFWQLWLWIAQNFYSIIIFQPLHFWCYLYYKKLLGSVQCQNPAAENCKMWPNRTCASNVRAN